MSGRNEKGFTLIEVAVAMLVAIVAVAAISLLGESNVRQRAVTDANASATNLAALGMEYLKTLPPDHDDLNAGTHSRALLNEQFDDVVGGPYTVSWEIVDDVPYSGSKKITLTVTHASDKHVHASLVTYFKVS